MLNLTKPDLVRSICESFAEAGAEILATNTFNANAISQADYGAEALVARHQPRRRPDHARASPTAMPRTDGPRWVAGAIGPTNKTLSLSPNVNDPAFREVDFDQVKAVYREQVDALVDGGVDFILIETIFDTLNAKAAIMATLEAEQALGRELPLMISMTLTDLSGRNLSGHTVEAFWASVRHAKPITIGLNCSFGAAQLRPHLSALAAMADTLVMAYPNAGLPNELGEYDEAAEQTAAQVRDWAESGSGEHRRRLLRDDSLAHRRHCRGGARLHAAHRPGCTPGDLARRSRADADRRLNEVLTEETSPRAVTEMPPPARASSISASAATSPARRASRSWSSPATTTPRSRSRATRSRTARRSSTSMSTRPCSTAKRR